MLSTLFFISCLVSVWASNWWQIDVLYKEVVPNNVYIFENSSVTFYCGSETPEYWMYSGENLDTPGHDIPMRQNHVVGRRQLTLHNVRLNDSGLYVCQGYYWCTVFTTHFSIKVYNTTIPKTLVVPNWVEIEAGGSITLLCGSDGPVEWFSPHIMYQDKVVGDKTLTLLNLQRNHSGKYICRGVQFYELDESGSDDDDSGDDEYDKGHNGRIVDVFYTPATVLVDREVNRVKNEIGPDKAIERMMNRIDEEEEENLAPMFEHFNEYEEHLNDYEIQ